MDIKSDSDSISSDGDGPVHRVSELMDASPWSNADIANRNSIFHRSKLAE